MPSTFSLQQRKERSRAGIALFSWILFFGSLVGLALVVPAGARAQDVIQNDNGHRFGFEVKSHYRDSDLIRIPSPFPFSPEMRPPGADEVFLETVDPGETFEVSTATVFYRGQWGEEGLWNAKAKVDLIDKHDRNPTSEDREWDVDELWVRFGPEPEPGEVHEGFSGFAKLGKFPKFERQDDRHLETYGLISTSFNRAEDVGLELGFDLGSILYMRFSFTQGNPVFYRDPNALAGDHGTIGFDGTPNPVPELQTGLPILYDADIDDLSFENPEIGLGLGVRLGSEGAWNLDLMVFGYERDLAETVELHGTEYGGDLDILRGPLNLFPLVPLTGDQKDEWGMNAWFYMGGFSFFGQWVEQDLGGLVRDGWEAEIAWDVPLPWLTSLFGRQVLPYVAPAARYSKIDPQFGHNTMMPFPSPSVFWDWEKLDLGVRLGLVEGLADLTLEYTDNTFVVGGEDRSADELLATLRIMWDHRLGI